MSGKNTLPEEALVGMLGLLQYLPSGITKYWFCVAAAEGEAESSVLPAATRNCSICCCKGDVLPMAEPVR